MDSAGFEQVGLNNDNGIFINPGEANTGLSGYYKVAGLTQSFERHGGVTMKVVDYDLPNQGTHERDYVFTSRTSTWEVSCFWQPDFQWLVRPACTKAISSAKVVR